MLAVVLLFLLVNVITIMQDSNWLWHICFIFFMSVMRLCFLAESATFLIAVGIKAQRKQFKEERVCSVLQT